MTHRPLGGWRSHFRCTEHDVLEAFRATSAGIRVLTQAAERGMTKENAVYLAGRLHEQRELIRQIMTRRDWQRVRHLLSIHQRQRERFLTAAQEQGFDAQTLSARCRAHIASLLEQ